MSTAYAHAYGRVAVKNDEVTLYAYDRYPGATSHIHREELM